MKHKQAIIKILYLTVEPCNHTINLFPILGHEASLQFARSVAKIVHSRLTSELPCAMKLLQAISKCLSVQDESVSNTIRESLNPLKKSIMSQSLARLYSVIDEAMSDEIKSKIIIEKVSKLLLNKI